MKPKRFATFLAACYLLGFSAGFLACRTPEPKSAPAQKTQREKWPHGTPAANLPVMPVRLAREPVMPVKPAATPVPTKKPAHKK